MASYICYIILHLTLKTDKHYFLFQSAFSIPDFSKYNYKQNACV